MISKYCRCVFSSLGSLIPSKPSSQDLDCVKANIKNNAGLIENITIDDKINYNDYFKLAQLAVRTTPLKPRDLVPEIGAPKDRFSMDALTIEHVKLDKKGAFGLRPNDFLCVARIALRSDNPHVPNKILALLNRSNYTDRTKCSLRSQLKLENSDHLNVSDGSHLAKPNEGNSSQSKAQIAAPMARSTKVGCSEAPLTLPVKKRGSPEQPEVGP